MKHTVVLTDPAEEELLAAYEWWAGNRSEEQAVRWYNGLLDALEALAEHPTRCSIARENDRFAAELRELHFGLGSRPTHRAIFTIRPDMILVYSIRHVSQRDWDPGD